MAAGQLPDLVRYLRRAAAPGEASLVSDADLLARFVAHRDESAFELLVWRHGRMVLGVCRRVLHDGQAAEDSFQATFLALARRARSILRHESVGGWLYRVAYRTALRARSAAERRAARESPLAEKAEAPGPDPCTEAAWRELRAALDEEVSRLPGKYREAFVLRCLSDRTAGEAAGELGCPVGTVDSRLARARERLRAALVRRGIVPAAALAVGSAVGATAGEVTGPLVTETVKAATAFAARTAVTASASTALAEGVLRSMLITKCKIAAAVVVLCGLGAGAGGLAFHGPGRGGAQAAGPADRHVSARDPLADQKPAAADRADRDEVERLRKEAQEQADRARRAEAEAREALAKAEKIAQELRAQLQKVEEDRRTLEKALRQTAEVAQLRAEEALVARQQAEKQREEALIARQQSEKQRAVAEFTARQREVEVRKALEQAERFRALAESRRGELDCNLKVVDVPKQTVSVTLRGTTFRLDAIPVAKDAKCTQGGKECELTDLKPGNTAAIRVETRENKSVIVLIRAD
jgi:RNA polymerase sigma factor (sigma-70 family)